MRDPKLIKTTEVPIGDIDASNRLRPVSDLSVEALIASIKTLGRMKDEIHIRKVAHQGGRLVLIAGAHRLEAAKRMGWEVIPAKIWDCGDDWASLLEIDDNLAHGELSALELSVFLTERKRVYEKLHPETKQATGATLAKKRWDSNASDTMSFAKSVAEKRNLSRRQVERYIKAGERLTQTEIDRLHRLNPTQAELLEFARFEDVNVRKGLLGAVETFECKNLRTACTKHKAEISQDAPKKSKDERDLERLNIAFKRASKAVQERFLSENDLARAPKHLKVVHG